MNNPDFVNQSMSAWLDLMANNKAGSENVLKSLCMGLAHVLVETSEEGNLQKNLETAVEFTKISIKRFADHGERRDW
jgi:hypothetical protein